MALKISNIRIDNKEDQLLVPADDFVISWSYVQLEHIKSDFLSLSVCVINYHDTVIWDSGEIHEPISSVEYNGPRINPGSQIKCRIEVNLKNDKLSFENSFMIDPDITVYGAEWMWLDNSIVEEYIVCEHYTGYSSPYFKKKFIVNKPIKKAIVYASSLGLYEISIGNKRIHDSWYTPGWTDYRVRIPYQAYDVTKDLSFGEQCIEISLGDGWYRGFILFHDKNYGDIPLKMLFVLRILYDDGSEQVIKSDKNWKGATGPIIYSDLQMGEYYKAISTEEMSRLYIHDVCCSNEHELYCLLKPDRSPQIKCISKFEPRTVSWIDDDVVIDFGQNISGFITIKLSGMNPGKKISLYYGEMLKSDGRIYNENLRIAKQENHYSSSGANEEIYMPHFTSHGFQFVEIKGLYRDEFDRTKITALALSADCKEAGSFKTGNKLINKLYSNLLWGQKSNFSSVPTDCPQRNERLGWTGDAQVFCATACYNNDCQSYYQKYCQDMFDSQFENGSVSDVVPKLYSQDGQVYFSNGNAAWADAIIIIPWRIYTFYNDLKFLKYAYPYMRKYADYVLNSSVNFIYEKADYGDWLNTDSLTDKGVIGTAFAAYDMHIMSLAGHLIGKADDSGYYLSCFNEYQNAFYREFISRDMIIKGDTQTAYILALKFGISREEDKALFSDRLDQIIKDNTYHLTTGFVGSSYLLPVLCDNGYQDTAYKILLNETYPSWLYSVLNGATTIWERWNSYTIEHGFGDVKMNSFNHYSLGAVGEWFFSHCAGIRPADELSGMKHIIVQPFANKIIGCCKASYPTAYGKIGSSWRFDEKSIHFDFRIPPVVKVDISLPVEWIGNRLVYSENNRTNFSLDPGEYNIVAELA